MDRKPLIKRLQARLCDVSLWCNVLVVVAVLVVVTAGVVLTLSGSSWARYVLVFVGVVVVFLLVSNVVMALLKRDFGKAITSAALALTIYALGSAFVTDAKMDTTLNEVREVKRDLEAVRDLSETLGGVSEMLDTVKTGLGEILKEVRDDKTWLDKNILRVIAGLVLVLVLYAIFATSKWRKLSKR